MKNNINKPDLLCYLIFALCFGITILILLKKFYIIGVNGDAPVIANLMWHKGWNVFYLEWEEGLQGSYYQSHSSLIFIIISLLSYLTPLNMIEYASLIFAITTGILGYVIIRILFNQYQTKAITYLFLSFFTIFFVFNKYNSSLIYLVHFEIFFITFLCGFLYYFFIKKYYKSYVYLFLFLITREDFGFHLFTLLATILFFNYFFIKDETLETSKLIKISFVACIVSVILCFFKSFFPGDSAFSRIYFSPHWPEILEVLNTRHILHALYIFGSKNIYTIINVLILTVFAIRYRSCFILISIISILPWFGIHILAKSEQINNMSDYYSFPFAIMLIWPALSCIIFPSVISLTLKRKLSYLQAIILVVALVHNFSFYKKIFPLVSLSNIQNNDFFADEMSIFAIHNLGKILVTRNIAMLNANLYKMDNIISPNRVIDGKKSIFYYDNDNYINEYATKYNYKYKLKINNTPIRLLTNENLATSKSFSNLAINSDFWLETLSLNKKHEIANENNTGLHISKLKLNNLKKRPIYLFKKYQYCGALTQTGNIPLTLAVYDFSNNTSLFKKSFNEQNNQFCFRIVNDGVYYWILNPEQGFTTISSFTVKKK